MSIALVDHDENWAKQFQEQAQRIEQLAIPGWQATHHIGSTSLSIASVPIIDILGVVDSLHDFDDYSSRLLDLGYKPQSDDPMPGRRVWLCKAKGQQLATHLQVFEKGHPQITRLLLFCEYLRRHPNYAHEYESVKRHLATQYDSYQSYVNSKSSFVKKIDRLAIQEHTGFLPYICPSPKELARTRTLEQIAKALAENVYFEMTFHTYYTQGCELIQRSGATLVVCNLPSAQFNYIIHARLPSQSTSLAIDEILEIHRSRLLPATWWVGPGDKPGNLPEVLAQKGVSFKDAGYGMYCSLERYQGALELEPAQLQIQLVRNIDDLRQFDTVQVLAGADPRAFDAIYSQTPQAFMQPNSPTRCYIGRVDGVTVVAGALIFHAGVAGIYYVATIPSQRRKGYATAMMNHLLLTAQAEGYLYATLVSSEMGKGVYSSLGFQIICEFNEYEANDL